VRVRVQKWGNSLALRIPKPFAEEAAVREGTPMDLSLVRGKLVAAPIAKKAVSLGRLLRKVSKHNLHTEIDYGDPVGREAW
jgi:antitoxin MazE